MIAAQRKAQLDRKRKALFIPTIRVFQSPPGSRDELCTVISNYVSKRREAGANTLHAFLYHVIVDLIKTRYRDWNPL